MLILSAPQQTIQILGIYYYLNPPAFEKMNTSFSGQGIF